MGILGKIIGCKSLKNSQRNFYDKVSFSKVIRQFSDSNLAIKRIYYRFFLENLPKTSCLKKIKKYFFWETSLKWTSVLIKLQPCSTQPWILSKKLSSCKTFTGKHPWWRLSFTEVAGLEFIQAISLKRTPSQSLFYMGSAQ